MPNFFLMQAGKTTLGLAHLIQGSTELIDDERKINPFKDGKITFSTDIVLTSLAVSTHQFLHPAPGSAGEQCKPMYRRTTIKIRN